MARLTNDRLYESNDSREIENASISAVLLGVSLDWRDNDDDDDKYRLGCDGGFLSSADGATQAPLSSTTGDALAPLVCLSLTKHLSLIWPHQSRED